MKKYLGKYDWNNLKKKFFDPIDKEYNEAKRKKDKLDSELWNYRFNDRIAESRDEYVLLMITEKHPDLLEQYNEYLRVYKLYIKAYNIVERRYEATFAYDWDPQGTCGGAIAANSYMSSAIEERDKLRKQSDELFCNNQLGELIDKYYKEYREKDNSDMIYKHPEIIREKRKAYGEARAIFSEIAKSRTPKKFNIIKKFESDDTILSELDPYDFDDLITTLQITTEELYPFDGRDIDCDEIELNLDKDSYNDEDEGINFYSLDIFISLKGVYEDYDYGRFHISAECERQIEVDLNKTTVGSFVESYFAAIDECREEFWSDDGEPFDRDEY